LAVWDELKVVLVRLRDVQPRALPAALLDLEELTAELEGPAIVRSGESVGHGLLLTNLTEQHVQIETNGHVTADVVDPNTGEVIGGSSGSSSCR
jgi:hypothetical protein